MVDCSFRFKLFIVIVISAFSFSLVQAQKSVDISLNDKDRPLREIIKNIETQSFFTFVFNEDLDMNQRRSIELRNQPLKKALNEVFYGTGIRWQIIDKHIILSKNKMISISGYVYDEATMETLIGAFVTGPHSQRGGVTNSYGYYSIQVYADSVDLQASYIGYKSSREKFYAKKDTVVNFYLMENETMLQSITVYDSKSSKSPSSTIELNESSFNPNASAFSENDLLKSLQWMPGIQPGAEGSAGIYVRGGGPDQNLILIDGVPVYNTGHIWDGLSVFNGDLLKKVEVHKSGFPARFGGRLSSVIDARYKDGNMQKLNGSIGIGLISAHLNIEGPIIKGKTSFSFSARRSYFDIFSRIARNVSEEIPVFYFYDMNAKVNHKFSDKSRLFISYYGGRDRFEVKPKKSKSEIELGDKIVDYSNNWKYYYTWGNKILSVRWNYVFNPNLFMNITGAYSKYKFNYKAESVIDIKETYQRRYTNFQRSGINDWLTNVDFEWKPNNNHYVRFGGGLSFHHFSPEIRGYKLEETGEGKDGLNLNYYLKDRIKAREASLYAEDEFLISNRLKANVGLHLSLFDVQSKTYVSAQPRLLLGYRAAKNIEIKASYTKMNQYVNLLSSNTVSQPTDLWVPITKKLRPMISNQFTLGAFANIGQVYKFSVEGFYKEMNNILEYKDSEPGKDAFTAWEDYVEAGKGRTYGVEFLARKDVGRFTGWLGYTLGWNDRKFPTINKGRRFPAKYDRRHNFAISGTFHLNTKVDFSASWVYATGARSTLALEEYQLAPELGGGSIKYVDRRNNYKMSPTHKLDVNIKYSYSPRKIWTFGVYNAYDRKNPYLARNGYDNTVTEYSMFGVIPSISYTYKFK